MIALVLIIVLTLAASADSFAESYHGLLVWALRHGFAGTGAHGPAAGGRVHGRRRADPIHCPGRRLDGAQPDGRVDYHRHRAGCVAANVGHVASSASTIRATAAVPPLAAAGTMAIGLGVLKRVVAGRGQQEPARDWSVLSWLRPWRASVSPQ